MSHTLYVLARLDIPDMNPGKAMAQVAHAAHDAENEIMHNEHVRDDLLRTTWRSWAAEAGTFGTTIVLEATLRDMQELELELDRTFPNWLPVYNRLVVDPEYPYRNYYGDLHFMEAVTTMWAFVPHARDTTPHPATEILRRFKLHR